MTLLAKKLLDQVLALDPNDRVEIADFLSDSIGIRTDSEYVEAWEAEIKERIEQYERGEVKGIPWRDVIANLGREVNEK